MRVLLYLPGSTNSVKALDVDFVPYRVAARVARDIRSVHSQPGAMLDVCDDTGYLLQSMTCTPRGWVRVD